MNEYLYLMHQDGEHPAPSDWDVYLRTLRDAGHFEGGSAIGGGECVNKTGAAPAISSHLTGYLRIRAQDLKQAKALLTGNPVFEAGGTVEIRELPRG